MGFWYFLTLLVGIFLLFRWISARKNNQANKATLFISAGFKIEVQHLND